ncbi:MAG: helix-turn-helix domain-containing protein [Sinomonas sp.]|nr:helix-turn-helix domain-containing protein [Sinomonas sp.]
MSKDLSIKEVADLTGQHPKTVAKLARQGVFPHAYKAGSGARTSPIRIPMRDVEAYRARQPRAAA